MVDITCKVIPKPQDDTTIFTAESVGTEPQMIGIGSFSYLCGKCELVLLKNVDEGQVQNVVFRCSRCQSFNELP